VIETKEKSHFSLRRKVVIAGLSFFFLVLFAASFFGKKGLIETHRSQREYRALLKEVERLETDKSRLEKEIKELESNPKAVEKKAREKLWLMKKDEMVLIIKDK
jgi:cell division protein FtsB